MYLHAARAALLVAAVLVVSACAGSFTGSIRSTAATASPSGATSSNRTSPAIESGPATSSLPAADSSAPTAAAGSYTASWPVGGTGGWVGGSEWKTVSGMLVNDGTGEYSSFRPILAPYTPPAADYAVEAQIRVSAAAPGSSFGVVARSEGSGGYAGGVGSGWDQTTGINDLTGWWGTNDLSGRLVQGNAFDPGMEWHTYRLEVRANTVRLLIDGTEVAAVTDNKYLDAGRVGLWSNKYQLEVRSFSVSEL